jgi:hypothetical protein
MVNQLEATAPVCARVQAFRPQLPTYPQTKEATMSPHRSEDELPTRPQSRRTGGQGPYILISALILALFVTPFAAASGEGDPIIGGERNPSNNQSSALTRETEILTDNGTYGTRQSNKNRGDGGGAIYGCRSAPGREPCVRANNLNDGRAFEFETNGADGGLIEVGPGTTNTKAVPFRTNAAAKVDNLNADRLDDLHAQDIVSQARADTHWALVSGDGTLGRKSGATASSRLSPGEYEVVFAGNVTACSYQATLGADDTSTPPAGEVGVAQRSGNVNAVSVVTRDSDGSVADRPFHLTVNC